MIVPFAFKYFFCRKINLHLLYVWMNKRKREAEYKDPSKKKLVSEEHRYPSFTNISLFEILVPSVDIYWNRIEPVNRLWRKRVLPTLEDYDNHDR